MEDRYGFLNDPVLDHEIESVSSDLNDRGMYSQMIIIAPIIERLTGSWRQ
jgi:hypothetical protein